MLNVCVCRTVDHLAGNQHTQLVDNIEKLVNMEARYASAMPYALQDCTLRLI